MRIDLNVPYDEKDEAKRLGARWDLARKVWYIENKEILEPFLKWMPKHLREAHKPSQKQQFAAELKEIMEANPDLTPGQALRAFQNRRRKKPDPLKGVGEYIDL